jgi:ABC-type polysaccharide/polyol phosphate transport system ATPase subunit
MHDVAIRTEGLSKQYYIGGKQASYRTLRDTLADAFVAPFRRASRLLRGHATAAAELHEPIWALKDISLEIKRGEVVGVIGRNGAGKSTLLKILSRITDPTQGYAEIRGRVGSLLEVGTGFNGELTGRENIYLNGAILGMKRAEIERRFDEIVAFSEIEKFIDTPVKHYSTGMYLRLAFAVAAHLEPEILIVDEVLAVGDMSFQEKCLGKMGEVAGEGRTVLFVSHNLQAISTLTKRSILLNGGRLVFDGDTYAALGHYRALGHKQTSHAEYVAPNKSTGIIRARVITSEPNQIHRFGKELVLEFEIMFKEKPKTAYLSFQVVDEYYRSIIHPWCSGSDEPGLSRAGTLLLRCVIPRSHLYMGRYTVTAHLSDAFTWTHFESIVGICPFEVVMDGIVREHEWENTCTYLEDVQWEVL